MELAKRCPFLKKVPVDFIKKSGPSVLGYVEKCPVMTQVMTAKFATPPVNRAEKTTGEASSQKECPFVVTHGGAEKAQGSVAASQKTPPAEQVSKQKAEGQCPFKSGQLVVKALSNVSDTVLLNKQGSSQQKQENLSSKFTDLGIGRQTHSNVLGHFDYGNFFSGMIQKKLDDHTYREFKKVNRLAKNFPMAEDYTWSDEPKKVTVWCSNDYLGMSRNPLVVEAARTVINNHGVGAGGTRNISGTSLYHNMLERSLADWHQKEAGLLFSSCYVANDTTLFTLGTQLPGCVILSDEGNHASMIHGIRTSRAKKMVFKHNNPDHLEELLKQLDPSVPKIVAFETVHSMTGAVCPTEKLCDVAHKYGALTFVDEVHAVGLYGDRGAGIGERDGVLDKIDIVTGTLGKAVGVIGGYIAGSASLVDTIRSYGSGFIFTTAPPPDKVAAALTSIELLKSDDGRSLRTNHQAAVRKLRNKLIQRGFPVEYAPSHIIPIAIGNPDACTKVSNMMQSEYSIYVQSINFPTVPRGQEKLRIAPTPWHTEDMMDDLVMSLDKVWSELRLPRVHPVCDETCGCQVRCGYSTLENSKYRNAMLG